MFLQEFQGQATRDKQFKKARREYSGGFKNYHPLFQKAEQAGDSSTNQSDFFQRLNIGNIKQLYLSTQTAPNPQKALYQSQQQAINRLTIVKKQQIKPEIEENNEEDPQNRQKFLKAYHKSSDFEQKANNSLISNQLKRLRQKFLQKYKIIHENYTFDECLTFFVMKYCKKLLKSELSTDELYLNYCNFINEIRGSKNFDKQSINVNSFDYNNLIQKNFYLFCKFKKGLQTQKGLNFSDIITLIRTKQQIQALKNDHLALKLLNKRYTVPYQTQLYKESRKASSIIDQIHTSAPIQQNHIFHANPIPKTTYDKPKQRPQSAFSKTCQKPFNLSQGHQKKKGLQQYYNWDRTFQAREAPKTTYQPKLINTLNEGDKKKRQQQLLALAAFPNSMNYLEDYKQYVNKKKGQLSQKYSKQHHIQVTRKQPPNFQVIHRQHLSSLENLKIDNKHTTVPKPFNLSKPKERKQASYTNTYLQADTTPPPRELNTTISSKLQPQSTMKYQALVALRKRQKQEKLNKKQEALKKQKKEQQQKKIYKQLLKERIDNQLQNLPQKKTYNDALPSNKIKVDLQKIYTQEPLLIERQSAKNKNPTKIKQIGWDPII